MDLQKTFNQIPVAKDDVCKTAMATPFGMFTFVGTSFSLHNSAALMQGVMDFLLRNFASFSQCSEKPNLRWIIKIAA